jgi:hypothetical protein
VKHRLFHFWLVAQQHREGRVGDFARAVLADLEVCAFFRADLADHGAGFSDAFVYDPDDLERHLLWEHEMSDKAAAAFQAARREFAEQLAARTAWPFDSGN